MNTISEKEYILSQPDMTKDDYNHWQKLMRAMTTSVVYKIARPSSDSERAVTLTPGIPISYI